METCKSCFWYKWHKAEEVFYCHRMLQIIREIVPVAPERRICINYEKKELIDFGYGAK